MNIRCRWHIAAGIITAWSFLASVALPIVCALAFLFYQKQQDKNRGTHSYLDIYEWAVVVYINVAVIVPLRIWGLV